MELRPLALMAIWCIAGADCDAGLPACYIYMGSSMGASNVVIDLFLSRI